MSADLPTPEETLEELADRATATIDRNASVAFDRALDEMTDFHRFLLALSAPGPTSGSAFSLAEVGGFMAPAIKWTHPYRRLHERASERIPDDTHYIRRLAYAPLRLVPGPQDERLSPGVMNSILDLGPSLVHRLEAWFTRRTVVSVEGEAPARRVLLAGSDERAYADALTDVVAGWESLHQQAPYMFGWSQDGRQSEAQDWDRLRGTWSYLLQHLVNTARTIAISVWNEDEQGAAMFCESLIRWPNELAYELGDGSTLLYRRMLFPGIADVGWDGVRERIASIRGEWDRDPSPRELLANTLQAVHGDVTLITVALLLYWSGSKRQQTDVAARMAMLLLGVAESSEDDDFHERINLEFVSLCLKLLRLRLAGARYGGGGYGAELDSLVRNMDHMTERLIVPGRSFTPSTLHDREGLLPSLLAILALDTRPEDAAIERRFKEFAGNDGSLPKGQESILDILDELQHLLRILENPPERLRGALRIVVPGEPTDDAIDRLRAKIGSALAAVQSVRDDYVRAADTDTGRLDPLRDSIEKALIAPPVGVLFREVTVDVAPDSGGQPRDVRLIDLNKAWLIGPSETMPVNLEQAASGYVKQAADSFVRREFYHKPRCRYVPSGVPNEPEFWSDLGDIGRYVGPDPVMMVAEDVAAVLKEMVTQVAADSSGLKIDRKPRSGVWPGYIATVHDVDVYVAQIAEKSIWLFSSRMLKRVRYAVFDNGHLVTLSINWHEGGLTGDLIAHFRQIVSWTNQPVVEVLIADAGSTLTRNLVVPRIRLRRRRADPAGGAE